MENSKFDQAAQEIGQALQKTPNLTTTTEVKTPHGLLTRIGIPRARHDIPWEYQHKKHSFQGEILGQPTFVLHFSNKVYGQDETYFRRIYQNSKKIHGGQATQFTERKIAPTLLGNDDQTMTLLIEKAVYDLSFYFTSSNEGEIRRVIQGTIGLMCHVWEKSKAVNGQWPRYVAAFLEPEYAFLGGKKAEDYLKDPKVIGFYRQTQAVIRNYLHQLSRTRLQKGFGFGDVKPDNLVEDTKGDVLFIDVGKPGFGYHWLSMLGQLYQTTIEKAPNTPFSRILKKETVQVIKTQPQTELAVQLFALGRINRYLLPYTLRNIVFAAETGASTDENRMRDLLAKVRCLTSITSLEKIIHYAGDEFDSVWRERLASYLQSEEFKSNLPRLKEEIDETLPEEKPEKKLVFLFMGIPGSGKSTLAEIIKSLHPSVILQSDWIFFQKLRDLIEADYYKAYAYQEELARRYLYEGYSVVMDDNNRTVKNRQGVYGWAKAHGAQPILVIIDIDPQTATDRQTIKGGERRPKEQRIAGLKASQSQLEKPTAQERKSVKIIRVDGTKTPEEIRAQLRGKIQGL